MTSGYVFETSGRNGRFAVLADIDLQRGVEDAWNSIAVFVPKLVGFLLILVIGYFIAKLIARLVDTVLERIGFDNWVERGSLRVTFEKSRFDPSDLVSIIVFWAAFLVVLQLAFGVFGPNPVSDLLTGIIAYLPNVFVAVIILVIASALGKVVSEVLGAMLGGATGGRWIARGAGLAILIVGIFAALNQLEIAPEIVNGLFYAILVMIVGSVIVAVGGGGIRTMQRYWERASGRLEVTTAEIKRTADPDAARRTLDLRMEEERSRMEEGRHQQQTT
jgi:Mechanosensitive ion channel, conserved TM helix